MPINILMPALSPTMEKGNLAKWHVKEGDKVSSGDVIAEIETDKATMEVEAVDEGTVAKILVSEGTSDVAVNDVIAILAGEGEDPSALQAPKGGPQAAAQPAADPSKEPAPAVREQPGPTPAQGYGREDVAPGGDGASRQSAAGAVAGANGGGRVAASPLARRMARESGIDLAALSGSGPNGRIVKRDIEKAIEAGPAQAKPQAAAAPAARQAEKAAPMQPPAAPAPSPQVATMSDEAIRKLFAEGSYEVVPHDNMRKTIARRLTEAKSTIPHFYLSIDCELDALLKLRTQLNAAAPERDGKPAYKLSVNDMVIKALALALQAVPDANVTWTSEGMLKHRHSDVGVAVSIPGGLITPIIRRAEEKTLSVISNEMKDLAARARARKLKPEEYQGGTAAVSNLGMYGIKDFSAVINPPHATILAVGAGEQRPVVKGGEVKVATLMTVTLSTDHRAVDGALGAELIGAFKRFVENPMGMLV